MNNIIFSLRDDEFNIFINKFNIDNDYQLILTYSDKLIEFGKLYGNDCKFNNELSIYIGNNVKVIEYDKIIQLGNFNFKIYNKYDKRSRFGFDDRIDSHNIILSCDYNLLQEYTTKEDNIISFNDNQNFNIYTYDFKESEITLINNYEKDYIIIDGFVFNIRILSRLQR